MVIHSHTKYHCPISREKCYGPDKKILFKKQLFDLEVKVQTKVIMVHNTLLVVMHPHTKYHSPISKDKKCYGPNKKILFKKPLFDLQVKGQGPTKVIMVCNTPPYGHAPTYQILLTYLERNHYLTSRSKDKVPRRSLRYVTHRLMVIHSHTKYHCPISREKCYGPDKKILFKKQLFDLRSKVKVPRMSLRYTTHRLMVMHPHIKYH